MFEDIAQMEKEIEAFRNNIVASSELIKGITDLTETAKKQQESFESASGTLVKKMDACVEQFRADHGDALQTLESKNAAAIDTLKQEVSANITNLTETAKKQQESFESASGTLVKKMDACVEQFRADHGDALQTLESKNTAAIDALKQEVSANMEDWLSRLEAVGASIESSKAAILQNSDEQMKTLSDECAKIISEMQADVTAHQSAYLAKLEETEKAIGDYQLEAENKYNSFVQRLETTNVDQIFTEVQNLKKSIQTKFAILMSGVGIAVAAAVLSVFIK